MQFEFATSGRIIFGQGSVSKAGLPAASYGQKALVVHGIRQEPANLLQNILGGAEVQSELFQVIGEPNLELIREAAGFIRQRGCTLVVAIGGGSVLDTGKGAAAIAPQPGDVLDYLEVIGAGKALEKSPLPVFAIPTTSGTGSEVTRNAVVYSPAHKLKVSLRSPLLLPRLAVIDPELMVTMPPEVTAATGMDALTQLIEPFVSRKANPMIDGFCREGIPLVGKSLRTAYKHGEDLGARSDMALAALLSGLALANSGLGAAHGLAGSLGGLLGAPHGALCARLLGPVIAVNIQALGERDLHNPALDRYQEIGNMLASVDAPDSGPLSETITSLAEDLKIPRLKDFGLSESLIPEVIAEARRASSMQANPIILEDRELSRILEMAS